MSSKTSKATANQIRREFKKGRVTRQELFQKYHLNFAQLAQILPAKNPKPAPPKQKKTSKRTAQEFQTIQQAIERIRVLANSGKPASFRPRTIYVVEAG